VKEVIFFFVAAMSVSMVYGQATCTADADGTGSSSFTASTSGIWTATNGATCPPTSTFTGEVVIDVGTNDTFTWDYDLDMTGDMTITMANGAEIIYDSDINVTGNIPLTNGGSSTLTVNVGSTLNVIAGTNGDMGDATNNNVTFVINGALSVDGTLSGKNGNGFDGSGTISAGSLDFFGEPECTAGGGCPAITVIGSCEPSGSTFCTGVVTPIVLTYFGAKSLENAVELTWTTASEENNDYFTLERSSNGLDYHELTRVDGAGNSFEALNYSYQDKNPYQGVSYYRLKQTDYDGTNETFKVVAVEFYGKATAVKVMQTLGGGNELLIHNNLDEENIAYIYDMTGRGGMIGSLKVGENYIDLNQLNAQSGMYTLRVVNVLGKTLATQKFVVQ